jgi:hypothetical protein
VLYLEVVSYKWKKRKSKIIATTVLFLVFKISWNYGNLKNWSSGQLCKNISALGHICL